MPRRKTVKRVNRATRRKTAKGRTTKSLTKKPKTKALDKRGRLKRAASGKGKQASKKRQSTKTSKGEFRTLGIVNETLSQLEEQAKKAYDCVQAVKKRSTPDWKEWIENLSEQDWLSLANAQRERIRSEVKTLADEILSKIHNADVISEKGSILEDAKENLDEIVNKIDKSTLVTKAIDTAIHTKDGLLAFLNIPTNDEMVKLQRKLKRLEHRMNQLSTR